MKEVEILGKNIKRFRLVKGLTQEDLAKKVGLSKDTISKIELGKQENPGFKYLTLIGQELDVSLEELFLEDPKRIKLELVVSDKNVPTVKAAIEVFNKFFK